MRVYNYLVILLGTMMLLNFMGADIASKQIINKLSLDQLQNFGLSDFFDISYLEVGGLLIGGAIAISSLVGGKPELAILAGFVTMLFLFSADMTSLVIYMNDECSTGQPCRFLYYVSFLVIVPLLAGYIQSIISWWAGREE